MKRRDRGAGGPDLDALDIGRHDDLLLGRMERARIVHEGEAELTSDISLAAICDTRRLARRCPPWRWRAGTAVRRRR